VLTRTACNMIMNLNILLMFLILHSVPFLRLPDPLFALETPCAERKVVDITYRER